MDSASSSRACSTALMSTSKASSSAFVRLSGSMAAASRSKTLMANQRLSEGSHLPAMPASILVRAAST